MNTHVTIVAKWRCPLCHTNTLNSCWSKPRLLRCCYYVTLVACCTCRCCHWHVGHNYHCMLRSVTPLVTHKSLAYHDNQAFHKYCTTVTLVKQNFRVLLVISMFGTNNTPLCHTSYTAYRGLVCCTQHTLATNVYFLYTGLLAHTCHNCHMMHAFCHMTLLTVSIWYLKITFGIYTQYTFVVNFSSLLHLSQCKEEAVKLLSNLPQFWKDILSQAAHFFRMLSVAQMTL